MLSQSLKICIEGVCFYFYQIALAASLWGVFLFVDLCGEGQSSGTAVTPRQLFLGCIREQTKEEKLRL